MVLTEHKKFYDEIFRIEGFLNSPFLMFGFQELSKGFNPRLKDAKSFKGLLHLMGVKDITVLDYEDKRADVHWDMNYPFNQHTNKLYGAFNVVADVGCLEHVFNTPQAMKNCMDAVKVGGLYFLHTPVAGYCKHGFHTFNCDMLKWVLENNGFEIEYEEYSYKNGMQVNAPLVRDKANIIMWVVARRKEVLDKFHMPIQERQTIKESYTTATYPWKDERVKGKAGVAKRSMSFAGKEGAKAGKKLQHLFKEVINVDVTVDGKIVKAVVEYPIEGFVGEGHDAVWLGNQNLNL